ncbi:MAG: O-antigen ligase family protein [Gammaproteobacteria bacterium]|nr:O-antigen ligase family protein [Gammaproteobacteria bacterium]MBU1479125.1 O-antigen ligase family protein [Gammaproteobacteria bacterium]MBU2003077.1 O-antigen ligase family protein [Gammaproteobacteria bacterium]MBU2134273.1 O-antigen ligase family protein [Gammaproteobacteria bacterium]MBU2187179.1 O-antigen ligase family protein [Gammaproteobacteria bacterium]
MILTFSFVEVKLKKQPFSFYIYFIILTLCLISSATSEYGGYYFLWVIKTIFSYFVIQISFDLVNKNISSTGFIRNLSLFSLIFLSVFVFGTFLSSGDRGAFVFGPNILYRVFAVLAVFSSLNYLFINNKVKGVGYLFFILSIMILGIFFTGSRGGIPVLLVVIICFIHMYLRTVRAAYLIVLIGVMTILPLMLLAFFGDKFSFSGRFANFDYEGNQSLALRLNPWFDFYNNFYDWVLTSGRTYPEFMAKFGGELFPYPHNLFLELIFFNGFFGFILTLLLVFTYLTTFVRIVSQPFGLKTVLFYLGTIIFIGCMFSGNLQDNFVLISIFMSFSMVRNEQYK